MKRNFILATLFALATLVPAKSGSTVSSIDAQVKNLAQRYNEVEAQLDRSIRYTSKDESSGATIVRQAWFNGTDDLIKVAVESRDGPKRELTEYIALDFENDYNGMFISFSCWLTSGHQMIAFREKS